MGIVQARMGRGEGSATRLRGACRKGCGFEGRERSGPGLQSDFWMGVGLKSRKTGDVHDLFFLHYMLLLCIFKSHLVS